MAGVNCEEKYIGKLIKYLLFCNGEPVEHPCPDTSSASVQCLGPALSLAVSPQSAPSPTPSAGVSAVTCCQCPTAKVKVEAGIGMVT